MPGRTSDGMDGASSRKRGPAHVRDSDDDDDDVQHVRSDVRAEGRKRVRLSDAADLEEDEQDYNPSDDEHERRPRQTQKTPQKSQYELMRDNNFEHLRHELADDQRATQRLRSRPILLGENAIAENGIIESVTCVNFMCHSRLHCELGPLLNFIVGENGSGKSAILTAITLCLGGKASSTNRGGSLKSFVKEGCDKAMLAVKIKNRGQDAYKPELYGESVIVERHFSKSGVSGFRVKSATDRVVSIKKQEVDELVEYYALQVDNPLNILSQDNARQFLNASSKQQKYKFFIEGVQLQQLDNDYRLIAESLEGMVAKVPDQEEHVKHAKAALEKAQRRMRELEGAKTLRDQGRLLRLQILWKQVEELEEELAARQRAVAEVETKIAEAQQNIDAKDRVIEAATEKIQRYETALENMKAEEAELQRQKEEVMSRALEIEQEVAELQTQHREAQQELKMKNEHAADIKQRIQEEEQRLRDTNGKEQAEAIRNMDAAKAEIARIEDAIREAKEKEPQLKETQKKAEEALKEIEGQVKTKRDERAKVEAAIKKLEESHGNILQSYEAGMPRLLHAIANETRFQTKPIGPLGMHIRLLKPEWTGILETTFGNNLNAFLVRNKHDERLLNDMMSRLNIRESPILITNPFSLDLTGKEPDPEYDTILRALEFDDQAVRDQLILLFSIEQIILVPSRIRAQEIMFDGAPPRNVQACLCFHDTKREGIRLVNRGSMSSSPVVPNLGQRPRMKTDDEYQILMHRDTLKQLQAEYAQIDGEWRRRQQEVSHCRREVLKLKAEREKLEAERPKAQNRVDECEAELDKFDGSDARLRNYQKQLAEVEQIIKETLGPQYGELTMKYEEKTDILNQVHAEVKAAEEKLKDWGKRQRAIVDKLGRVKDLLNLTIGEKNALIASFAGLEEAKREAEGKVERQAQRVEIHKAKVHEISPHRVAVDPNVSLKTLDNQYNEILGLLEKMKHRAGMDEQQAHAALEEAARNYEKAKHELASTQEINRKLRHSLTLRLEKWRKFQRYISSQSRANFIYLLSERGFRGKLLLDHEAKSLDLQVEPDKTEKRAAGRSTKTLSGGEKSFASICLLLAIWEAMGSPLRCLDEFDVFMDNVNRAISTNMLITAARRSVNRQYIFITPNAIEGRMSLDKDVKIIRLTDPRQRTLTDHH